MPLTVCTLFEGNYHHGVAALCNSLYTNGYRGIVYVGYRGDLPQWSNTANSFDSPETNPNHRDIKIFHAADGLDVYFIKLEVGSHLAHHKPEFMLQLLEGLAKNMTGIVYFDPDIVVKCNWTFFNNWMQNGVGIVQEINGNIMPIYHPTRFLWRHVADVAGEKVINPVQYYYNCGFCGVTNETKDFLRLWSKLIRVAIEKFKQDPFQLATNDKSATFWSIDQDTFNISVMCTQCIVSDMGPEAMDFIHGGFTMSHAIGGPKPWAKNFLTAAIKGIPPSTPEKAFWQNVGLPISTFSASTKNYKTLGIKVASFIGRFYRKY